MTDSVESEWRCARLMTAFGSEVAPAEIGRFGNQKALIVERFDRRWMENGKWIARGFVPVQLAFRLLAATDGHAKHYSIFLHRGGGYAMTPLYDVLSAWPIIGKQAESALPPGFPERVWKAVAAGVRAQCQLFEAGLASTSRTP